MPWGSGTSDSWKRNALQLIGDLTRFLVRTDKDTVVAAVCVLTTRRCGWCPLSSGYYTACEADYWYHGASGGYPGGSNCTGSGKGKGVGDVPTDLSNNSGTKFHPAAIQLNGTYNTRLLAAEATRLVTAHDSAQPFYMYLAFMAVHDGCTGPGERNGRAQLTNKRPARSTDKNALRAAVFLRRIQRARQAGATRDGEPVQSHSVGHLQGRGGDVHGNGSGCR